LYQQWGQQRVLQRCFERPQTGSERILVALKLAGRMFRRLVRRCWVHPLDQLLLGTAAIRSPRGRSIAESVLSWGRYFGLLLMNSLVIRVCRLSGPDWSVIYVGEGDSVNELRYALFTEPASVTELERIPLWQVPRVVQRFLGEGFLVVSEINRLIPWQPQAKYAFVSPPVVRQVLDVTQPPDALYAGLKKELRRHIRRVQTQGFIYEPSQRPEDFDLFYHHMYLPFIQKRYGELATITSYRLARRYFDQGELIFVRQDGQRIGGTLVRYTRETYIALLSGVCEEHVHQMRQGISLAMYWFDICRAWELGLRQVDLGRSRSRTSDGVFAFKRQWGAHPVPVEELHVKRWFLADQISPNLGRYLNSQGFLAEREGKFWQVVFRTDQGCLSEADCHRLEQRVRASGLAGLMVLDPPVAPPAVRRTDS